MCPALQINDPAALVEQLSKAVLAVDVNSAGNEVGSQTNHCVRTEKF